MGITMSDVLKYRNNLIEYGKKVSFENPDNITNDELKALVERIFKEINRIDMRLGYQYHSTGIRKPAKISEGKQEFLFTEFLDWYQVINTPSQAVYEYVMKKYPAKEFPRVLCVGDGINCHLGRKLAMQGYNVVSVDPEANTKFTWHRNANNSNNKNGKFKAVQASFFENSENMINWAHLIVGNKIPPIVQELVKVDKPSVFTISANPEIYKMKFNGVDIVSEKQFMREIKECPGVKAITTSINNSRDDSYIIFEKEARQRNLSDDDIQQ